MKKRLCIITGSRAEWGLFYPLAKEIKRDKKNFILQIVATGAHLSRDYGMTYKEIEGDGFKIDRKVNMLARGDFKEAISKSVSAGIVGITSALRSLKPDIIFLLGDRFETFSAAIAALFLKIPISHIHGGELTEGSLDDSLRHAITKMTSIHFVSTDSYRRRVIQMGEEPSRVFNVGALGLDNIKNTRLLDKERFEKRIDFKLGKKNIMVTFNPSTAEEKHVTERQLHNLLQNLDRLSDAKIIFTKPNPDIYSNSIARSIDKYVSKNDKRAVSFISMGRELYLSALCFMDVVAGNSSSGVIEVPSFYIPTVNIGRRECGRIQPASVINASGSLRSINKAFNKAFSTRFRKSCKSVKNPYGDGDASQKIIKITREEQVSSKEKRFYDIKYGR